MHDPIRILIAEDNALLRGVLRDALAEAGMTVVAEASDGGEAIELPGAAFCLGVLWHPEEDAEGGGPLFRGLVKAARAREAGSGGLRISA